MDEQRISVCKSMVHQIASALSAAPHAWQTQVPSARSVIASLDATSLMANPQRKDEQIWVIDNLQKLAFSDPDTGGVTDITSWCYNKWLALLPHHPNEVRILQGIGHYWLMRAQPSLARIHANDGSSSSSSGGSAGGTRYYGTMLSRSEEERQAASDAAEAAMRLNTSDYVEARGLLPPATEYLGRAVEWATHYGLIEGYLLALAAEAYISLGNVSSELANQQYFVRAIGYLRQAVEIPGFSICPSLQSFLDDYGRFA